MQRTAGVVLVSLAGLLLHGAFGISLQGAETEAEASNGSSGGHFEVSLIHDPAEVKDGGTLEDYYDLGAYDFEDYDDEDYLYEDEVEHDRDSLSPWEEEDEEELLDRVKRTPERSYREEPNPYEYPSGRRRFNNRNRKINERRYGSYVNSNPVVGGASVTYVSEEPKFEPTDLESSTVNPFPTTNPPYLRAKPSQEKKGSVPRTHQYRQSRARLDKSMKEEIALFALQNGVPRATEYFEEKIGRRLRHRIIEKFIDKYKKRLSRKKQRIRNRASSSTAFRN